MNNLSNMKVNKQWAVLAKSIGEFMNYWGFRGIHGQVWAITYLSKNPVSGVELTKILSVSKALISPAIKELEFYDLIYCVSSKDQKTKLYKANPDVFSVIKKVLKTRELVLINKIYSEQKQLEKICKSDLGENAIDKKKLDELADMIFTAYTTIHFAVDMKSLDEIETVISKSEK